MSATSAPVIRVYEPALCCATGVCGPELDQTLVQFTADLAHLRGRGVDIQRYNLAIDPGEFAANPVVRDYLRVAGSAGLPLTVVDGITVGTGSYLSRATLSRYAGLAPADAPVAPVAVETSDEQSDELCCTPEEAAATGCCADAAAAPDGQPDELCCTPEEAAATGCCADTPATPGSLTKGSVTQGSLTQGSATPGSLQLLPVVAAGSCCGSTGGCC
jgi:hypothetical protein